MSSSKDPETKIVREGDDGYEALRHGYIQGLWEKFYLTGDVNKLATFIREGGDPDRYGLLEEIAGRLDGTKTMRSNRGGPKDERNLTLYLEVCSRIISEAAKNTNKSKNVSAAIRHVRSIKKPDMDADYDTKANYKRDLDGATKQFNKGKTLFIERHGRPWVELNE